MTKTRRDGRVALAEKLRGVGSCLPLDAKRKPASQTGIESWYPYYAGYTEEFTRGVLRQLGEGETLTVLDPWNGSGTTTRIAHETGHRPIGRLSTRMPNRIGAFAVEPDELAAGTDAAIFRLFVTLSMYQALRDVIIMRQQRSLSRTLMRVVADTATLKRSIARHACLTLGSVETFEQGCDVGKDGDDIDCGTCPGVACHVKDATRVFNRMGDMGKLPTSAWLRLWRGGGVQVLLEEVCREEPSPTKRAALLVERFAAVHRVGRKLATMFVSALSTPALAPGLTPWFPQIDGNELVVIDTNVAHAVDALRAAGAAKTYDARERWVRERASKIDLRAFRPGLPSYSPRLVQEALYVFCSKSNRVARGDGCANRIAPCGACAPTVCPFARSQPARVSGAEEQRL